MNLTELASKRRAYRKLKPIEVTPKIIKELLEILKFAPSCDNKQPWRFVFIYEKDKLIELNKILYGQNSWVKKASLLIGVFSSQDLDCAIEDRNYYLFDTGIAVSYMMLRATEMGLVAHPISYYDEEKAKKILNIPERMQLITILAIGKHMDTSEIKLTAEQEKEELERPKRLSITYLGYLNNYIDEYEENKRKFSKFLE